MTAFLVQPRREMAGEATTSGTQRVEVGASPRPRRTLSDAAARRSTSQGRKRRLSAGMTDLQLTPVPRESEPPRDGAGDVRTAAAVGGTALSGARDASVGQAAAARPIATAAEAAAQPVAGPGGAASVPSKLLPDAREHLAGGGRAAPGALLRRLWGCCHGAAAVLLSAGGGMHGEAPGGGASRSAGALLESRVWVGGFLEQPEPGGAKAEAARSLGQRLLEHLRALSGSAGDGCALLEDVCAFLLACLPSAGAGAAPEAPPSAAHAAALELVAALLRGDPACMAAALASCGVPVSSQVLGD
jgi:hypothetical protein